MPSSDLQNLGSVIRRERERAGLSIRQLASDASIVASTLLRIESGSSAMPEVRNLQAIARALHIDVEELYAAGGYFDRQGLPELRPYLRAKYGIAGDEASRIEGYVQALRDRPAPTQQQPSKEESIDDQGGNQNP